MISPTEEHAKSTQTATNLQMSTSFFSSDGAVHKHIKVKFPRHVPLGNTAGSSFKYGHLKLSLLHTLP